MEYSNSNGGIKVKNNYSFFQNRECEHFPCHKVDDDRAFNCLFCYCPLYTLGDRCGGNFYYTETGIKVCSNCVLPHSPQGYDHVISKFPQISELARKQDK